MYRYNNIIRIYIYLLYTRWVVMRVGRHKGLGLWHWRFPYIRIVLDHDAQQNPPTLKLALRQNLLRRFSWRTRQLYTYIVCIFNHTRIVVVRLLLSVIGYYTGIQSVYILYITIDARIR